MELSGRQPCVLPAAWPGGSVGWTAYNNLSSPTFPSMRKADNVFWSLWQRRTGEHLVWACVPSGRGALMLVQKVSMDKHIYCLMCKRTLHWAPPVTQQNIFKIFLDPYVLIRSSLALQRSVISNSQLQFRDVIYFKTWTVNTTSPEQFSLICGILFWLIWLQDDT